MSKEQLRAAYPDLAKFKDDFANVFGDLVGIEITDKEKKIVQWGESWGECVEFPLTSKDMK